MNVTIWMWQILILFSIDLNFEWNGFRGDELVWFVDYEIVQFKSIFNMLKMSEMAPFT